MMEAEQASLSTIVVDGSGNPIGQVIYRCALCRKICDSSSDAMLHYQTDHIELTKLQIQQQHQHQTLGSTSLAGLNNSGRNSSVTNLNLSSSHFNHNLHPNQHSGSANRQVSHSSSPSSGSLLKRAATSSTTSPQGSLLKRTSTGSASASAVASNSLLKRASNVMRLHQSSTTRASSNKRPNLGASHASKPEPIHRQYTTTSASRAAKRHGANAAATVSTQPTSTASSASSSSASSQTPVKHGADSSSVSSGATQQSHSSQESVTTPSKPTTSTTTTITNNTSSDPVGDTSSSLAGRQTSATQPKTASEPKSHNKKYSLRPRSMSRRSAHLYAMSQ